MSDGGGLNNLAHHLSPSSEDHLNYIRDSNYYYPDGSAIFLVDNVLFKVRHVYQSHKDECHNIPYSHQSFKRRLSPTIPLSQEITTSSMIL
jgi:hypothetical protein